MNSKLSDNLSVDLTKDVLTKNPRFKDLMNTLSERFNKNGLLKDVMELSDNIKLTLMQRKKIYFSKLIIYKEMYSIFIDRKFNLTSDLNQSQDKYWDMYVDSNIQEFLSDDKENTFGLKEDNLSWNSEDKIAYNMMILITELQSNLREKCEKIVTIYNLPSNDKDESINTSNLHHLVDKNVKELKILKQNLKEQTFKRILLFNQFYECLIKCSNMLVNILKTHQLRKIPSNSFATIQWIVSHCEALCLKTKMMELQLQSNTYTKDVLKALKVIKKELDRSSYETNQDLKQVTSLLNSYSSLGEEFQSVVNEFSKIKSEIDNRNWALSQLK